LKTIEKYGVGGKGVRLSNGRGWMDQSKVHSQWACIETTPLNINLDSNNEEQDCKKGTTCVWGGTSGRETVNEGD
jgi:hypothetical protein